MLQMFIRTDYGMPYVTSELQPASINRLAAMSSSWIHCKAFDGVSRYDLEPLVVPSYSAWQRLVTHMGYNPSDEIKADWKLAGECHLADIVSEVEKGLENDDDIIQQWFGADDVLTLLRSATTFAEMVDRVRCVCGEFETDDRLRRIVDSLLPHYGT